MITVQAAANTASFGKNVPAADQMLTLDMVMGMIFLFSTVVGIKEKFFVFDSR
jgi:hypothetical protein